MRLMLEDLFGLKEVSVHFPEEIDWDNLPPRAAIQIHWNPEEPFYGLLRKHGVRVVVMARHPLDVLISWLNYAYHVHQEGLCHGERCRECAIVGALPRSRTFVDYAQTEHGRLLLGYTPAWWDEPGVIRMRYEDLVADAEPQMTRLVDWVGEPTRRPIAEVVQARSIRKMKPDQEVWHFHYWQGQPGLWRSLFPAAEARELADALPDAFGKLGYACDPDESLDPVQADLNWTRLQLDSLREYLTLERKKRRKAIEKLIMLQDHFDWVRRALYQQAKDHSQTRRELYRAQARVTDLNARLLDVNEVGPRLLGAALRVKRAVKSVLGPHRRAEPGSTTLNAPHFAMSPAQDTVKQAP
jgi:hypothetical protein